MNLPLISVVIPTYNVEKFVAEAINSIQHQTYSNLEIIIVDDCSTDGTYKILQELAKDDRRIKLFRNEKNKRIVESLNFALKQVTGEYVLRMDGDDVSLPTRIEDQYQYLINHPHLDLVGLDYIIIDEDGNEIQREKHLYDFEEIKRATKYVSPVPHFWLAKKNVYDKVGEYRIAGAEDYDFILRALDKGFKISNAPKFLYLHRIRNGNTATSTGLIQKKSFYYIKRLHAERAQSKSEQDSFSNENLRRELKTSVIERFLYGLSAKCHYKYVTSKRERKNLSFLFLVMAILFSPRFTGREKYYRFLYRKLL